MICPRCGNEWDTSKASACVHCGFVVRGPQQSGPLGRTSNPLLRRVIPNNLAAPAQQTNRSTPMSPMSSGNAFSQQGANGTRSRPLQNEYTGQPAQQARGNNSSLSPARSGGQSAFSTPKNPNSFAAGLPPLPRPGTPIPATPTPLSRSGGQSGMQGGQASTQQKNGMASWETSFPPLNPPLDVVRRSSPPSPFSTQSPNSFSEQRPSFMNQSVAPEAPARENRGNNPASTRRESINLDEWTARTKNQQATGGMAKLGSPAASSAPNGSFFGTSVMKPDNQPTGGFQRISGYNAPRAGASAPMPQVLTPGALLRNGRYRLQEKQNQQDWLNGVYEARWLGQDSQHPESRVLIYEVMLPDVTPIVQQSLLRTATMSLSSVGRHPHIPALWDAFNEHGRTFFVFEQVEGETIRTRARRLGRPFSEQEVLECSLQMAEVLELLGQQSPPLVHGMITPDTITVNPAGNHYMLTNFSIILAGGATQFISGIDRSKLSPYTPLEFSRGLIDGRSDLYSLIATAYYIVTGSIPARNNNNTVQQARALNPTLSQAFDAILSKELRAATIQRYQRPSELRQDLLAMRSVSGTVTVLSDHGFGEESPALASSPLAPAQMTIPEDVALALPILRGETPEEAEFSQLLPRPDEMWPLAEGNDRLVSAFWFSSLLAAIGALVIAARFLS